MKSLQRSMKRFAFSVAGILLACLSVGDAATVINLSSQTWALENGNGSVSTSTTLPAYPLEVLRSDGVITDPLHRYGELATRWIALDNWTFSLSFSGSTATMKELLSQEQVLLKLGGIDTFATVTLNGQHILSPNNFHRKWSAPVKQLLVDGENQLEISIRPAMLESLRLKEEHPYNIPLIHQMGSVGVYTFVRKPASDLGWDWGPAYSASGIHGNVELLGYSNAYLEGAYVSQRKTADAFEATITSQLLVPPMGDEGELTVAIPELKLEHKQQLVLSHNANQNGTEPATFTTTFVVNESDVKLWWPVGYGDPNLYNVSITYTPSKSKDCGVPAPAPAAVPGRSLKGAKSSLAVRAATSPDGSFRIMQGLDLPGDMTFEKKATDSLEDCNQLCKDTAGCMFYTFATPPDNFCWLKKPAALPGATFAVKLDDGRFDRTPGVNVLGFDLGAPAAAADVAACESMCSASADCHMFVFLDALCQLKQARPASLNRLLGVKLSGLSGSGASLTTLPSAPAANVSSNTPAIAAAPSVAPGSQPAPIPRALLLPPVSAPPNIPEVLTAAPTAPVSAAADSLGGYGSPTTPGGYFGSYGLSLNEPVDLAAFGGAASSIPTLDDLQPFEPTEPVSSTPFQPVFSHPDPVQRDANAACSAAAEAKGSQLHYRIGFRTVELIRIPIREAVKDLFPPGEKGWDLASGFGVTKTHWDGSWAQSKDNKWEHFPKPGDQSDIEGESFYFKVNGVAMYMKGANLVPMHVLPTNVTKDTVHDILNYALESNMNMIRIWGGGMYPVDEVFKFSDEHGLLVWMETMFACAPYPRDTDFIDNVAAEVTQQVQRLSWHPSVGVWAGNNEIEGSLNWYSESRTNKQLFAGDYIALFVDTVRSIIRKTSPTMAFVDSSPSNGAIVDDDRQYIKRWGEDWDPRYGDVHHYAYDADCEDYSTYPKAKFISEFGSQSYPTFATYAEATKSSDWQVDNQMTGFRNRRFGNGLEVFEAQFKRHFRLPSSWSAPNDPEEAFKLFRSFLYITHMQQARCYEAAINYWRRLRSQPSGLTMGVLYWQLNDIAEFASWSAYDYGGRWKPLAYAVKRMYAPLQVQLVQDGPQTKVFVVNDHTKPVNVSIAVQVLSLDDALSSCSAAGAAGADQRASNASHASAVQPAAVFEAVAPPGYAAMVWTMPTADLLASREGCSSTSCYVAVTATSEAAGGASKEVSEAQLWLVPLKDINLPDPTVQVSDFQTVQGVNSAVNSTSAAGPHPVTFTVKSSKPAALTYFNTKIRGRFSDDAFTALHPCQPKVITFYPHVSAGDVTAAQLAADLTVDSLFDHQYGQAGLEL